jgi:hypothetical protein
MGIEIQKITEGLDRNDGSRDYPFPSRNAFEKVLNAGAVGRSFKVQY